MDSEKHIGLDVHQATIVVGVIDSAGKFSHGIHPRDQSGNHSSVLCRLARNFVGDLRGRGLVRLAVRFAQPPRGQTRGVQSAEECVARGWEQE